MSFRRFATDLRVASLWPPGGSLAKRAYPPVARRSLGGLLPVAFGCRRGHRISTMSNTVPLVNVLIRRIGDSVSRVPVLTLNAPRVAAEVFNNLGDTPCHCAVQAPRGSNVGDMTTVYEPSTEGLESPEETSAPRAKSRGGRPDKGKRDAIMARPDEAMGDDIIFFAARAHLTPGEYMVKLAAEELGMPQYVPEPMMRTLSAKKHQLQKDGRYSFLTRPAEEFGRVIKVRAEAMGLTYGDFMVLQASKALQMPQSAPALPEFPEPLDIVEVASQTAA